MKKLFLSIILISSICYSYAATYYFKAAATDVTLVNNWCTDAAGTITAPAPGVNGTFTGVHTYIITNISAVSLSSVWTLASGSIVQVGDATNTGFASTTLTLTANGFIVGANVNIPVGFSASNTVKVAASTGPTWGTLSSGANGSTVEYNGNLNQFPANAAYHNLTLSNGGITASNIKQLFSTVATNSIAGILRIDDGCTFRIPNGGSEPKITGNFTTASNTPTTSKLVIESYVANPITSGIIYNFNVEYTSTGYCTPMGGTYNENLSISGAGNTIGHFLGSETFNINKAFNLSAGYTAPGVFDPQTSTFNYSGTSAQNIAAIKYHNLNISGVRVGSPTITWGSGNLFIAGNCNNTATGTYSWAYNSSTVNFNSTSAQAISGSMEFGQVIFAGSSVKTFASGTTKMDGLTVNSGTTLNLTGTLFSHVLNLNTSILNVTAGSPKFNDVNLNNGSTINISGTSQILSVNGWGTYNKLISVGTGNLLSVTSNSTIPYPVNNTWPFKVEFIGTGEQTVVEGKYNIDLTISGSHSVNNVLTTNGDIVIFNTLTTTGLTFTTGKFIAFSGRAFRFESATGVAQTVPTLAYSNLTINSNVRNVTFSSLATIGISGTFTANTGPTYITNGSTLDFNGDGGQSIPTFNYGSLIISGARAASSFINVSSNGTTGGTIGISGSFSSIATGSPILVNDGNTFDYNGTGSQTIAPYEYNNLIVSNARVGNPTITLSSLGTIMVKNNFTVTATNAYNWVSTGNTFNYKSASAQTVYNASNFTYNNLSITNNLGIKTLSNNANTVINGVLSIESGSTLTLPATGLNIQGTFTTSAPGAFGASGKLLIEKTGSAGVPVDKDWKFIVEYNSTGTQYVPAGIYNNLNVLTARGGNKVIFDTNGIYVLSGDFDCDNNIVSADFTLNNATFTFNATNQVYKARNFIFNNIILTNTGEKNMASVLVSGKLSVQNTATASGVPNYGTTGILEYKDAGTRTNETVGTANSYSTLWGGTNATTSNNVGPNKIIIDNTTINQTSYTALQKSSIELKTGGVFNLNGYRLDIFRDYVNLGGTLNASTSTIHISGTTTHSVDAITCNVLNLDKQTGTTTFNGNIVANSARMWLPAIYAGVGSGGQYDFSNSNTINISGHTSLEKGTLNLNSTTGITKTHNFASVDIIEAGKLDMSSVSLTSPNIITANVSGKFDNSAVTGGVTTSGSFPLGVFGLIRFNGTTQDVRSLLSTHTSYKVTSSSTTNLIGNVVLETSTSTAGGSSFTVETPAKLICNNLAVTGGYYFTLENNSTIVMGSPNGINDNNANGGNVLTGVKYFNSFANYEYKANNLPQNTGVFTTQPTAFTVNNLTINNTPTSTGLVTAQQSFAVNGVFAHTAGVFAVGGSLVQPQTLTLNGTLTNSSTSTNTLRSNTFSSISIGNTGTGGSGALGNSLFFDQTTPGKSSGADATGTLGNLTPGVTNNFQNFTLNRTGQTITLGSEMQVNNTLTPTAGTLASAGNLVMLSTDETTSSILALGLGASITGNVIVQSFFKGGTVAANRGFRMIASPTGNTTTFFPQIKERFIVTCVGGPTNGCDFRPVKSPNAQTLTRYLEPGIPGATSFDNINHSSTMEVGRGYYFFFRGSRQYLNATTAGKINEPFSVPEDWTAAYTGPINSGNISVPITKTVNGDSFDGLNLVGNPYPAVLNFTNFREDASNTNVIDDFLMIMKRDRSGFITYSGGVLSAGTISAVQSSGGTTATYPFIQPGQAFFVRKKVVGPTNITLKETHKATAADGQKALRTLSTKEDKLITKATNYPAIRQLIRYIIQNKENQDDATIVLEAGNSANYGGNDAPYLASNTIYTYSLSNDDVPTSINFMPAVADVKEIKLYVEANKSEANLRLNFTELIGAGKNEVWLKDNYTQTKTLISEGNRIYNFGIDKSIKTTSGKDRFVLFFVPKVIYEINLIDFTAVTNNIGVQLNWETLTEDNASKFELQRSIDGLIFETINTQTSKALLGNSTQPLLYSFVDKTAQTGKIYYRLKMFVKNETSTISEIKSISFGLNEVNTLVVYPSLVKNELNMRWKGQNSDKFNLAIYDLSGKLVLSYSNLKGQSYTANVAQLNKGVYILKVKDQLTNQLTAVRKFLKD